MPRIGRDLEILTKHVEAILGGQGLDIQSPEYFKDKNGKIIGEIDLTIRGKLGTTSIFVGIECRKRKYKADIGWIEQLIGRRHVFKFDKIVAVSSSGFTGPAINLADYERIDLIHFRDQSDLERKLYFKKLTLNVDNQKVPFLLNSHSKMGDDVGNALTGIAETEIQGKKIKFLAVLPIGQSESSGLKLFFLDENDQPQPLSGKFELRGRRKAPERAP